MKNNSSLNILKFSRTISIILIVFLFFTYLIQIYLFNEMKKLQDEKQLIEIYYENIHEFMLQTELLLSSYNIKDKKKDFKNGYLNYKQYSNKITNKLFLNDNMKRYINIVDIKVQSILNMLDHISLNQAKLKNKPVLVRYGEISRKEDESEYFILLKTLVERIQHMKQYQSFLLEDFLILKKIITDDLNKDIKIFNLLFNVLPILIIVISTILAFIIDNLIKNKEYLLLNTKKLLENIINSVPVRIFWKDKNGKYLGANKLFLEDARVENIYALVGKSDFELTWKKEAEKYISDDNLVMNLKKEKKNIIETQVREDGTMSHLNTSKVPLLNEKGDVIGIIGLYEDITEKINSQEKIKEQELQLIQQNRLAQLGEMLAMIAHQWRQPLTSISSSIGVIELLSEKFPQKEMILEKTDIINNQLNYLSTTINDFRDFFMPNKNQKTKPLNDIINETLKIIGSTLQNNHIEIVTNLSNSNKNKLYNTQLSQVLLNILKNLLDAFLENNINDNRKIFIDHSRKGEKNIIMIKDNAGGISADILNKIFYPYFSTKGKSHGTGLGLYMSKMIVEKYVNGSIEVQSNNSCTIFKIVI